MNKMILQVFTLIFLSLFQNAFAQTPVKIISSSEMGKNLAANVFDNEQTTRWESKWEDGQWLQFEYAKPQELYGLNIKWETAAAFIYSFDYLDVSGNWVAVITVTNYFEGAQHPLRFATPVKASKFRLNLKERLTSYGFSIFEIKLDRNLSKNMKVVTRFSSDIPVSDRFFTVKKEGDKFWFFDGDGKRMISKAVNCLIPTDGAHLPNAKFYDVSSKYKDMGEWAQSALKRMRGWHFNTVGSWSHVETFRFTTPFTVYVYCGVSQIHRLVDVFDPAFEVSAGKTVRAVCMKFRSSKYLVGYYIDNELPWWGDVGWFTGHSSYLLDEYMKLPSDSPGKLKLVEFLRSKYPTIKDFNTAWMTSFKDFQELNGTFELPKSPKASRQDRDEFAGVVADRYFQVWTSSIKKYDPDHLILGCRFAGLTPAPVVKACSRYFDVISVNHYAKSMKIDKTMLDNYYFWAQKPLMITEFSYRAMENNSGDMNSKGADVTVPTQKDRAIGFEKYVTQLVALPYIIGYHWFQYCDQSPEGRNFDGENSDYGIVDIYDVEYPLLVAKMKEINLAVDQLHADSIVVYPTNAFDITDAAASVVRIQKSDKKRRAGTDYCDFSKTSFTPWSDNSSTGTFIIPKLAQLDKEKIINVDFSSGTGWGCGFGFAPTLPPLNPDGSADLSGFKSFRILMRVPNRIPFQLFLSESGADVPDKGSYAGVNGADGESFAAEPLLGTGEFKEYVIPFEWMSLRNVWGNQQGDRTINLGGSKNIDFYIPGNSGTGKIEIKKITLE